MFFTYDGKTWKESIMDSHIVFLNNVFYHEQNLITVFFLEKVKSNNLVDWHYNHRYMYVLKEMNLEANSWNVPNFL